MKPFQSEMPVVGTCFNLSPESGVDMDRVLRDQRAALAAECAARKFFEKMRKKLSDCPGVVGFDAPKSENSAGRVVVEPRHAIEAGLWLKRRFEVSENIELSPESGLLFDIRPRCRRPGVKRHKFQGRRAEQFDLAL